MDFFKISTCMLLGSFPKPCRGSWIHSHTRRSWPGALGLGSQGSQQALPPQATTATCVLYLAIDLLLYVAVPVSG